MRLLDFICSLSFCEYNMRDEVQKSCNPILIWKLWHARAHRSHIVYFLTITNSNMIDTQTLQSVFTRVLDHRQTPSRHKHNTSVEGKITRWRLHTNCLSLRLYGSNKWTTGTKDVYFSMMIGHNLIYTCELKHLLWVNNYKVWAMQNFEATCNKFNRT